MNIYLISNNLVLDDITYESDVKVDEKRKNRPLSIEGEKMSSTLSEKFASMDIYSSSYASAISSAKYMAHKNKTVISINADFDDVKIGQISKHNIQMLRFMQDKNFDYKYPEGESLNEARLRLKNAFQRVASFGCDAIIFTHKRAILALLLNYCDEGYNLDDRLILSYNDKVVLDDHENDLDIIKITFEDKKIVDIDTIEI